MGQLCATNSRGIRTSHCLHHQSKKVQVARQRKSGGAGVGRRHQPIPASGCQNARSHRGKVPGLTWEDQDPRILQMSLRRTCKGGDQVPFDLHGVPPRSEIRMVQGRDCASWLLLGRVDDVLPFQTAGNTHLS